MLTVLTVTLLGVVVASGALGISSFFVLAR